MAISNVRNLRKIFDDCRRRGCCCCRLRKIKKKRAFDRSRVCSNIIIVCLYLFVAVFPCRCISRRSFRVYVFNTFQGAERSRFRESSNSHSFPHGREFLSSSLELFNRFGPIYVFVRTTAGNRVHELELFTVLASVGSRKSRFAFELKCAAEKLRGSGTRALLAERFFLSDEHSWLCSSSSPVIERKP